MAEINDTTLLPELLLSILHRSENSDILKKLLHTLLGLIMELEVSQKTCAKRYEHSDERKNSRSGFRQRRFDTRLGALQNSAEKKQEHQPMRSWQVLIFLVKLNYDKQKYQETLYYH